MSTTSSGKSLLSTPKMEDPWASKIYRPDLSPWGISVTTQMFHRIERSWIQKKPLMPGWQLTTEWALIAFPLVGLLKSRTRMFGNSSSLSTSVKTVSTKCRRLKRKNVRRRSRQLTKTTVMMKTTLRAKKWTRAHFLMRNISTNSLLSDINISLLLIPRAWRSNPSRRWL